MVDAAAQGEVTFGPFTLTPGARRLTRDGAVVPLGSRSLDILTALVGSAARPLSRAELMAAVWPNVTVGEASLRVHVAHLRKALGDGEGGARYIATLAGRGYCFVAPVSHPDRPRAPSRTGNLPPRAPLIGRDAEIAEVAALIGRERLATIVGPGGVGKTRLAIAAGWRAADAYPDGVWLVDLAPLSDPSLVVSALATALGLAGGAAPLSAAWIASVLRDRRLLLVLDNCEHLVSAAAELAATLVEGVPGLTVLATSQESLRIDAEWVYRLGPLALPPPGAADIAGYGAVDLFAQRALAADLSFQLSPNNAVAVANICRRLDGVPLSLEMAAARVPSLGLGGLRASLEARLQVLSAGLRTADVRHQTLRRTVEWSVGLLSETEALVFRRLGIFSGGCSLDAAAAVVAVGETDRWTVVGALGGLVDRSVVTLDLSGQGARYRLLETLRLYARELLQASGEWERLAEAHARWVCQLFAVSRQVIQRTPTPEWQAIYLPDLDNLRSAQGWALADPSRRDLAIELAAASGSIWAMTGLVEEGQRLTGRMLDMIDDHTPPVLAGEILRDAGMLRERQPDHRHAHDLLERATVAFRRAGDEWRLTLAKVALAQHIVHTGFGQPSEAAALLVGAREILSASGQTRSLAVALNALGLVATRQQNVDEAIEHFTALAALASQLQDARMGRTAVAQLANLEFSRGALERAVELGREAVDSSRSEPGAYDLPRVLHNLAAYLLAADRLAEARPVAQEALSFFQRGHMDTAARVANLQMWALIGALEGRDLEAARLIGWVDAVYASAGSRRAGGELRSYERLVALLRAQLSEAELSARAAEGARWEAEAAMRFAFDRIVRLDTHRGETGYPAATTASQFAPPPVR